jgi:putative spermidine/putrescine transport system substrate-binding protein
MKKKLSILLAVIFALTLVFSAVASATETKATEAKPVATAKAPPKVDGTGRKLIVGIWGSTQEEIVRELIIPRFEKETGAEVELVLGGSSDRNAMLYSEVDNPSMDVVYLNKAQTEAAAKAEVIQPPNPEGVPEYEVLYEPAKASGGYGVAFMSVGIMYSTKEFDKPPTSWKVMFDEKYNGKVAPFVFPGTQGTAFLVMAARLNGGGEEDIEPGIEAIEKLKPIPLFASGIDELNLAFENGDVVLAPQIGGYVYTYIDNGGSVGFAVPEEGAVLSMNCAAIPKNSKNADLAEAWINMHLGQEVQQAYAERLYYGPTSASVVLDDELAAKVVYGPEAVEKLVALDDEKITENQAEWTELWNTRIIED